jgi:undecaprenyl-diphosphatase
MHHHLSWAEAIVVGLFQGVSELFPVSSLGHTVLIPALIGGSWAKDLDISASESPYLAYVVGLHVATALALVIYFWRDWVRIVGGLFTSIRDRSMARSEQRLAWLLIGATIPVGLVGLVFEHTFRTVFGKPLSSSLFLALNGLILLGVEQLRRKADARDRDPNQVATEAEILAADGATSGETRSIAVDERLGALPWPTAMLIGGAQIGALFSGISRSGIAMSAGLFRGLSNEDAARFSFLLATPVILAAGVLKLPDLTGPLGAGVRPQILVGSIISGIGAYVAVRFLDKYFQTRSLRPFGVYCLVAGVACAIRFGFF